MMYHLDEYFKCESAFNALTGKTTENSAAKAAQCVVMSTSAATKPVAESKPVTVTKKPDVVVRPAQKSTPKQTKPAGTPRGKRNLRWKAHAIILAQRLLPGELVTNTELVDYVRKIYNAPGSHKNASSAATALGRLIEFGVLERVESGVYRKL